MPGGVSFWPIAWSTALKNSRRLTSPAVTRGNQSSSQHDKTARANLIEITLAPRAGNSPLASVSINLNSVSRSWSLSHISKLRSRRYTCGWQQQCWSGTLAKRGRLTPGITPARSEGTHVSFCQFDRVRIRVVAIRVRVQSSIREPAQVSSRAMLLCQHCLLEVLLEPFADLR